MKKCQKCKTPIDDQYTMCSSCNDEYSNEIAIRQKESKEEEQTVNFYKLFLIYKFVKHNTVVLSFIDKYKHIANRIIDETKHMGFVQDKRYEEITKTKKPPYMKLRYIKAPLTLIPAVRAQKKDRKWYD